MQAQETQTESSLSSFSRGWTAQAAARGTWIHASSLRRVSMTQKPLRESRANLIPQGEADN